MKKLIKILNTFALLSTPVVVSWNVHENEMLESTETAKIESGMKSNPFHSLLIANDSETEELKKNLEQLNQEIGDKLLTEIIIADGYNTYSKAKEKIAISLPKLALNKNITMIIEFKSDIFNDDDIIYKIENPFEINIELISDVNPEVRIKIDYKAPLIEGVSKIDLDYQMIKEAIENVFATEKFQYKLVRLSNLKANGIITVKDVADALNKINNADVFGEDEQLNEYKFQYSASLHAEDKIIAGQSITIDLNVYDVKTNTLFLTTKFNLKFIAEAD